MTALLFAGDDYEAAGGWRDLIGEYDTVDDAKAETTSWSRVRHTEARKYWTHPGTALYASTNTAALPRPTFALGARIGDATIIEGPDPQGQWLLEYPAKTETYYLHDWAHIVQHGDIVANWNAGEWTDVA